MAERTFWEYEIKLNRHRKGKTGFDNLDSPLSAFKFIWEQEIPTNREELWVIALDIKNHPRGIRRVSAGNVDSALMCQAEFAKFLMLTNCPRCIMFHNHPSGDVEISSEDAGSAALCLSICKLFGIKLLDFLTVGQQKSDGFYSCGERGILDEINNKITNGFEEAIIVGRQILDDRRIWGKPTGGE